MSPPFIPFDDTLSNREFIRRFPVPGILGIEEYLPGTLLSYLLRYGVVAFGYEAGRHDDPRSVEFHRAMLALCLERAGCLDRSYVPQWTQKEELLKSGTKDVRGFYEIRFRYLIDPDEQFSMLPGFKSFQPIHRNQTVAKNKRGQIAARESGQIFMPLYQSQGAEGFFIVRPVHRFWLELSRFLRHWKFDRLLALLPGVRLTEGELQMLVVDRRIARFLTRQVFHLLGYRRHSQEGPVVRFARREK